MNKLKKIIIATIRPWNIENANKFKEKYKEKYQVYIIDCKEDLIFEKIKKFDPAYIFFPHWSWIIPESIYKNFKSILFHMTDLPYGKGGSPLQNLILNKVYNTKISAISVEQSLDSGKIYLKEDFYIGIGSAQEIFQKLSDIIFFKMIHNILQNDLKPIKQSGKEVIFKRRKPEESNILISNIKNLNDFYDFIRMLDAQEYPKAFVDFNNLRIYFSKVKFENNKLVGSFEIKKLEN